VTDDTAPVVTCPADITVDCNSSFPPTLTGGMATATDNCSTTTIEFIDEGGNIECDKGGAILRTFTAVDACDNQATCSQIISVTPRITTPDCSNFVVTTSEDITICNGSTAQLITSGAVAYTWSPTTGLDDPFSANPAASPTSTTTYTVTGTDGQGCEAQAQVTVIVTAGPTVSAGQDVVICNNQTTQLNASGGLLYLWSPALGLSDPTSATPTANPSVTTTYSVVVTDANGCSGTDDVVVTVETIQVSAGPDQTVCNDGSSALVQRQQLVLRLRLLIQ